MRQCPRSSCPCCRPGRRFPPYEPVPDPPMQVEVPEKRWADAWRLGVLAPEIRRAHLHGPGPGSAAADPGHGHGRASRDGGRLAGRLLQRPGTFADGDFVDGSGNFCVGKLFHETALFDYPGYDTYELVHNGGTGRILYDLAEHYFLTGDAAWFKKNQWRMQAAAEWIIRQRKLISERLCPTAKISWWRGCSRPSTSPIAPGATANGSGTSTSKPGTAKACADSPEAMAEVDPDAARAVSRRGRAISGGPPQSRRPGHRRWPRSCRCATEPIALIFRRSSTSAALPSGRSSRSP